MRRSLRSLAKRTYSDRITGDNRHVAGTIGGRVGLRVERVVTGSDLKAVSDEALLALARKADVFRSDHGRQQARGRDDRGPGRPESRKSGDRFRPQSSER